MLPALPAFTVRYIRYEELRPIAEQFLSERGWRGDVPVNIERFIDVGLGIDIVTKEGLTEEIGADGFLTRNRRVIYIDSYVGVWRERLFRFTLAHELAHWLLHEHVYDVATFNSPTEWLSFMRSLPEEVRLPMEWQANALAGLLLVPREQLGRAVAEARYVTRGRFVEIDLDNAADRQMVLVTVARRFNVSPDVIEVRGRKDGLWND
jgi:Zn-dependent peptidase ImmA (M78 family)